MHSIQCSFVLKDLAEKHSEGTKDVNLTASLVEAREDAMSWDPASEEATLDDHTRANYFDLGHPWSRPVPSGI